MLHMMICCANALKAVTLMYHISIHLDTIVPHVKCICDFLIYINQIGIIRTRDVCCDV